MYPIIIIFLISLLRVYSVYMIFLKIDMKLSSDNEP